MRRIAAVTACLPLIGLANVLPPYRPTTDELRTLQIRSTTLGQEAIPKVLNESLTFTWINNESLFYRLEESPRTWRFVRLDVKGAKQSPLFDHAALADAFKKVDSNSKATPDQLNLSDLRVVDNSRFSFQSFSERWIWDDKTKELTKAPTQREPQRLQPGLSPDQKFRAKVAAGQLQLQSNGETEWRTVAEIPYLARIAWSPESKVIFAQTQIPGDRREVTVLNSALPNLTRSQRTTTLYDQPGDKLDTSESYLYDVESSTLTKIDYEPITCGGHPWASPPDFRWWQPKGQRQATILLDHQIRGNQAHKIIEINPKTAAVTTWVNEVTPTFIHLSQLYWDAFPESKSVIWRSERDGWAHLYEFAKPGEPRQITRGNFVVRSVHNLTEKSLIFSANGREPGDPYWRHTYKVNRDGTSLIHLTPSEGYHEVTFAPDFKHFVDKVSTVQNAPVYTLRNDQGKAIAEIIRSDASPIRQAGINGPVEFVAKGRDGVTDIYGLIHFPTQMNPTFSYPIIEDIYAGPHDSHVPKTFTPIFRNQQLAELGFIVVQIDGMGTANRGKKFHDVAHKNVADAGLPDRITWIKAAAAKYPQMDTTRVGIYGTSAGGQNSTGALLFHPEFYKVAVSSCGCHDNRMDKVWWNEQWMGYPVGPHYEEQSNITNAAKLQGKLMLMVGEVDSNVPPESTFRLVDALIKARKDFDFVYLPGLNHTGGGSYGERKRRDFFIRHLHGVAPPTWD
jgi:dienelactone hydrolase